MTSVLPELNHRPEEIARALSRYGYRLLEEPTPVEHSIRNQNYRAVTDRGPLFVRFHRSTRRPDLRREHRVIQWASEHSLPVVPPLPSPRGETFVEVSGRLVTLFPWISGTHLERGQITPTQAAIMGSMHGRLHAGLAHYPDEELAWFWDTWGPLTEDSAVFVKRCLDQLPSLDLQADEQKVIHRYLELQLGLIRAEADYSSVDPTAPGAQPVHGDFHERNLLLNEVGGVAAVFDWEAVTRMPRGFELVRCLTFADLLDSPLLDAYLTAYHEHIRLSPGESKSAVELWWRFTVRQTWLCRVWFIEEDRAVQPFFAEGIRHLERFGDRSFRAHLVGELERLAGSP